MAGIGVRDPYAPTAPRQQSYVDAIGRRMVLSPVTPQLPGPGEVALPPAMKWMEYQPPTATTTTTTSGSSSGGTTNPDVDWQQALRQLQALTQQNQQPTVQAPTAPATVNPPAPAARQPSQSLGFARAKDAASRIGNKALEALRSQMVSRGIEGSGVEGRYVSNILGETARGTADAAYNQAKLADEQQWDAAKLGYQGAISQRGQDIGVGESGYQGQISQRGQNMSQSNAWMQLAPTILGLLARRSY